MKKTIALLLSCIMLLSLASCGGSKQPAEPSTDGASQIASTFQEITTEDTASDAISLSLGETFSTDIIDFTLKDVKMSYYASSNSASYGAPRDKDDGLFVANVGTVLVIPTFTIKNKDRGDLEVGDSFDDFELDFSVNYDNTNYRLLGYDLNDKNGSYGIDLSHGSVSYDGGKTWNKQKTMSFILRAGEERTFRTVCVCHLDPAQLTDAFEFCLSVPASTGEKTEVVYKSE